MVGSELRTIQEVRDMNVETAALHEPVTVRGVVTFFNETLFSRFIQDSAAGIYLFISPDSPLEIPPLMPGQVVEVQGVSDPGEFAPVIIPQSVRIIGETNLPVPKPVTFEQLASGAEDSQFVEISGVVRSVEYHEPSHYYVMEIATGEGRLAVYVQQLPIGQPEDLVDCKVRARGVCATRFNRQRQLFAVRLMVPRPEDLTIVLPAPEKPYETASQPIGSLLQFARQDSYGHRVKVTGTVIYFEPGRRLYLQEQGKGLEVQTRQSTALDLGDRVEVLGFVHQGDYTPVLQDASYRKVSAGNTPVPYGLGHDEALKGTFNYCLVQITAILIDRARNRGGEYLILQESGFIFQASLNTTNVGDSFARLEHDSMLSITGVCRIDPGEEWQAGPEWRAKTFQVLLRSPDDVRLLRPPPWWTPRKVMWIAGLLALVTMVAFAWVGVLRRRVNKQTKIIRERLQVEAALKDRYEDLFENANDMVFTHELNGRITSINKTGERLLQRGRARITSQNLIDLVAEDQRVAARQWLEDIVKETELTTTEWDFVSATGHRVKLEISSRLIERDGRPVEVEGIARDITERRRLERELLEISNREQRRIGHDLHDGVCQQLAAIAYLLDMLGDNLQKKSAEDAAEADRIGRLVNEANTQARGVARGLFPVRLQEHGLVLALQELVASVGSRYRIECQFKCETAPVNLDDQQELHLYFIAQEALLNAVKHGKSTRVTVSLNVEDGQLKLVVEDNGCGYAMPERNMTGMGIRIMRYRAKVIGATLEVHSQVDQGTRVACLFSSGPHNSAK